MKSFRILAVAALALPLFACAPRESGTTTTDTTSAPPAATTNTSETTTGSATTTDTESPTAAGTNTASPMAGHDMSSPGASARHDMAAMGNIPYDAMFLDMMIHHHQQAVEMSEELLPQAKRPQVKQLAETIMLDQQQEIDQMRSWRQSWYPDAPAMSEQQISQMMPMPSPATSSQDPEERFLVEMIPHHEDAVRMSQEALQKAEHPELKTMAQAIIAEQQIEISQMRELLGGDTAER